MAGIGSGGKGNPWGAPGNSTPNSAERKYEIRMSKYETNSKQKIQRQETAVLNFRPYDF